jgi:Zn ribbon nucleic-acid-binding protein
MNAWTFTGHIAEVEKQASPSGRRKWMITLRTNQEPVKGCRTICRFAYWHESVPPQGALCVASGHFSRRKDKNEPERVELMASELQIVQPVPACLTGKQSSVQQ